MGQFIGTADQIESNVNKVDEYNPNISDEAKALNYPSLKVIEQLFETLGVDCVVEQGASGIWTYRKWKSGIAECWAVYEFNCTVGNSPYILDFPFEFTDHPVVNVGGGHNDSGNAYFRHTGGNATSVVMWFDSEVAGECKARVYAIGRWK